MTVVSLVYNVDDKDYVLQYPTYKFYILDNM